MKLNKENYEVVMFDLLEGNLSEREELHIMKQIESDEFFFKEWKLFKSTVLIADRDVVYTAKDVLLKEEKTAIVLPMYSKWMAVAASVCILAAVITFWPKTKDVELVHVVGPIEINKINEVGPQVAETPKSMEVVSPTVEKKWVTKPVIKQNITNVLLTQKTPMEVPQNKAVQHVIEAHIANKTQKNKAASENEKVIIAAINTEGNILDKEDNSQPKEVEILAQEPTPDKIKTSTKTQKALAFVTNNPPSRIRTKIEGIIALVRHPQLRIKTDFSDKRPALNIELETDGYQAIASLTPFKNRNN